MQPLSVLMHCSQYHPRLGGAERQAAKLAAALQQRGCRVTVLTPRLDPGWSAAEDIDGVAVHRFPLVDLSDITRGIRGLGLPNLLVQRHQVRRALRTVIDEIDVVHAHIASPLLAYAMGVADAARVPIVCKVGSSGRLFDLSTVRRTGLAGKHLAKLLLRGVRHWIATSETVRAELLREGVPEDRIVVIPNGVVVDAQARERRARVRRILYLGRLATTADRDVSTLVRAFGTVARKYADAELALVGGGDLLDATREEVVALGLSDRVQVPGFGNASEWIDWADCFVLPSRVEGMSNALLEAMAAGLPCVANDIPPNREVLDDGAAGLLVPVGDENALLDGLRWLMNYPSEADDLGLRGRQRARDVYSIESVAERHMALYREVTGACAE